MIEPAHGFQREIRAFMERGLWDGRETFGPATFMGWATEAEGLVAGVALHDWHPVSETIEISAYSTTPRWLTRQRFAEVFGQVFDAQGARAAVQRCSEGNRPARKIWQALGAHEVLVPELRAAGEAECVSVLTADQWRASRFAGEKE